MSGDPNDMSTPVTRGELREELANLEIRLEQKLEQKLEQWGGALLARLEDVEKRLSKELARHVRAFEESIAKQISAVDDKYADLPGRVGRLETKVFAPRRSARRAPTRR